METKEQDLVTKEYLDVKLRAELQSLRADILQQLIVSQRWNTTMILGLYAMIALAYFTK